MKKLLCLFTCLFLGFALFAEETTEITETTTTVSTNDYGTPSFDSENAFVIDVLSDNLKFRDYIKMYYYGYNATEFSVYWYNPDVNKWWLISKVPFSKNGQVGTIYTSLKTVKKAQYYAIVPASDLEFKYSCEVKNHDLKVTINCEKVELPEPVEEAEDLEDEDDEPVIEKPVETPKTQEKKSRGRNIDFKDADVFNISDLGVRDLVRFVNRSSYEDVTFDLYVLPKYSKHWVLFGTAYLHDFNDTDYVHSIHDIEEVDYIAIKPHRRKDYSYNVYEKHHDLYIEVVDFDEDEVLDF